MNKLKWVWDRFKYLIIAFVGFIASYFFFFRGNTDTSDNELKIQENEIEIKDKDKELKEKKDKEQKMWEEYQKHIQIFEDTIKEVKPHDIKEKDSDSAYRDIIDFINKPTSNSKE